MLLNLIDHLPRNSFLSEAFAADEMVAEALAGSEMPDFRFRFSEWSPNEDLLAAVYEQLQVVANILLATAPGGKPRSVHRWPRPQGALEDMRTRRRFEAHYRLVEVLLPDDR